ncbi:MAG: hypothetical protein Q8Q08_11435 [Candidatus Omnitrophota bacterium]|nr:hypothetical protein [Candidatus Omnitrophota bacterium]MDZ4243314.1 hypothetical protein [Candidatus Omnitrophota bacterium]
MNAPSPDANPNSIPRPAPLPENSRASSSPPKPKLPLWPDDAKDEEEQRRKREEREERAKDKSLQEGFEHIWKSLVVLVLYIAAGVCLILMGAQNFFDGGLLNGLSVLGGVIFLVRGMVTFGSLNVK